MDVFVTQQHRLQLLAKPLLSVLTAIVRTIRVGLSHAFKVLHVSTMDSIKLCISERNFEVTALGHDSWVSF